MLRHPSIDVRLAFAPLTRSELYINNFAPVAGTMAIMIWLRLHCRVHMKGGRMERNSDGNSVIRTVYILFLNSNVAPHPLNVS